MTPQLALRVSMALQLGRIRHALISAAPTRLSCLKEVPAPVRPRTVTPDGMDRAARQRIYHARHVAKVAAQRAALQARRRKAA